MAKRYYELHVAGCVRQLPILNVSDTLAIAGFLPLGDTELLIATGEAMAKRVPEGTEVLLTAEAKGIPIAQEMARNLGMKRYVIARKALKAYMEDPVYVEDESITTAGRQRLYLDKPDLELLKGKKVLLVDDVISTGGSMKALQELVKLAQGTVIGQMAILAEGDAADRKDIIYLEKLPLFDPE